MIAAPRLGASIRLLAAACLCASLGCGRAVHQVKADRAPSIEVPEAFAGAGVAERATAAPPAMWWRALGDPGLDALCSAALAANLDLARARTRIASAEALAKATGAARMPQINLDASLSEQRQNVFFGQQISFNVTNFPVSVSAAYEVDLWGRVAAGVAAAELEAEASREDLQAAAISVTGAVADAWYALVAERASMALLDAQEALGGQLLELVEFRFGRGLVGAVDVLQQRSQVEAVRSLRPAIEMRMRLAEQRLAILLGKAPGSRLELPATATLPEVSPTPPAGVPAQLLAARPDIRAAQRRMLAVDHRLAVAKADLLPALRLSASTGFAGRASENAAAVFFDNWIWQLFAGITAPLWDGGRRRAEIERVRAGLVDAIGAYTIVVQRAFAEVEEALVREQGERASMLAIDRRIDLVRRTLDEVRFRYTRGNTDYLPVLTTLATLQALEQERLGRQRALLTARLGLLRAMGGAPLPIGAGAAADPATASPADATSSKPAAAPTAATPTTGEQR